MLVVLVILLVLALAGGGVGYSRYGARGWSPAAILLAVVAILLLTGYRF